MLSVTKTYPSNTYMMRVVRIHIEYEDIRGITERALGESDQEPSNMESISRNAVERFINSMIPMRIVSEDYRVRTRGMSGSLIM